MGKNVFFCEKICTERKGGRRGEGKRERKREEWKRGEERCKDDDRSGGGEHENEKKMVEGTSFSSHTAETFILQFDHLIQKFEPSLSM